jgi:GH35 family endo-1,4-beta-xylanase
LQPSLPAAETWHLDQDNDAVTLAWRDDVLVLAEAADREEPWQIQWRTPSQTAVSEGDVVSLYMELRATTSDGEPAYVAVLFEKAGPPWTKSLFRGTAVATDGWTRLAVPFVLKEDHAIADANLCLRTASPTTRMELRNLRLVNHGPDVDVAALPRTEATYPGSSHDAAWRAEAAERIDRLRKADLRVLVVDAAGTPLPNVDVEVEMTRHAFPFGTAVEHEWLFDDSPNGAKYRDVLTRWFNYVTTENELKQETISRRGIDRAIESLHWLKERHFAIRGHTVLWPSVTRPYQLPEAVRERYLALRKKDAAAARAELAEALRRHLVEKLVATRGLVRGWDVANEAANLRDVMDDLEEGRGPDAVLAEWFRLARAVDPDAELYVNDYGIVTDHGSNSALRRRYIKQVENLIARSARPDAIGVQSHFYGSLTGPVRLWQLYDELAATGVPIEVTEFDVDTGDAELDGRFARDFLTASFAHEDVRAIIVWGFWARQHWRPKAAMFDADWSIQPTGEAWRDLVMGEWWTDETGRTGNDGRLIVRGFKGDYVVRVGGQEVVTHLPGGGGEVRIELPPR